MSGAESEPATSGYGGHECMYERVSGSPGLSDCPVFEHCARVWRCSLKSMACSSLWDEAGWGGVKWTRCGLFVQNDIGNLLLSEGRLIVYLFVIHGFVLFH